MGFHPVNTQLTFQGGPSPDLWGSSLHVSPSPVLCPTKSSHLCLPNSNLSPHLGVATARIPHPKCSSKSASRMNSRATRGSSPPFPFSRGSQSCSVWFLEKVTSYILSSSPVATLGGSSAVTPRCPEVFPEALAHRVLSCPRM